MQVIKFMVLGEPKGKGRPRFTKQGHTYTPEDTAEYEELVQAMYLSQCKERFSETDMLDMRITAFFRIPKNTPKYKRELMLKGVIRPSKKPDTDNIVKIIADALNKTAYPDDKQIVDTMIRKFYSDVPRVEIKILKIGGNENV